MAGAVGCTKKSSKPAANESEDVKRGRTVYMSNCIACHNSDPRRAGTLGPDVYGSSLTLLEHKVVQGVYPPGHEPKRKSQAMPPLPQLKDDVPALHAFLNAP